jgi:YfiH family protein
LSVNNKHDMPMWISIPMENKKDVVAIFTTRHGGVSSFPYNTLNLSFQRNDSKENVMENFRSISESIGIPMERMVLSRQVHGSNIEIVDRSHFGMGLTKEYAYEGTDGLVTAHRGVALVTFYADCTPVYLYDPVKKVIGLVHSGWRSTLLKISSKAVQIMKARFNCQAGDIIASLGPHIRDCCFEVRADVYWQFAKTFPDMTEKIKPWKDKWKIDLSGIIKQSLCNEGLQENRIYDICRCTVCEKELFFSHRGGNGNSGIGAALLMMTE